MPDPNGTEIAEMYVGYEGILPQAKDEPNHVFRNRVAQVLRTKLMVVDAHEVQNNRFHDEDIDRLDGGDVRKGIMGAAALAVSGHGDIDSTVVDSAAADLVKKRNREQDSGYADMMMMLAIAMGGR